MSKRYYCILLTLLTFSVSLSQEIDAIVATLEIDTPLNNGPKDNRVNIAFANITNASSSELLYNSKTELADAISEILTYFDPNHAHAKSGFSQYRNFFNVQRVWFPEPLKFEQAPEFYELAQGIREALFLPWNDENHGFATMIYTGAQGNGAGVQREKRVVMYIWANWVGKQCFMNIAIQCQAYMMNIPPVGLGVISNA